MRWEPPVLGPAGVIRAARKHPLGSRRGNVGVTGGRRAVGNEGEDSQGWEFQQNKGGRKEGGKRHRTCQRREPELRRVPAPRGPVTPLKQEKLSTQPKQPLSSAEPVPSAQPLVPKSTSPEPGVTKPGDNPEGVPGRTVIAQVPPQPPTAPTPPYFEAVAAPETVVSSALTLPIVSTVPIVSRAAPVPLSPPDELSTEELVAVAVVLQRKVKVLQQRRRRHRARLAAMEGLVEQLRRDSLVSEERLKLACLQPVTPDPASAVTIICQEEEEEEEEEGEEEAALVYAGTSCGLSLAGPL